MSKQPPFLEAGRVNNAIAEILYPLVNTLQLAEDRHGIGRSDRAVFDKDDPTIRQMQTCVRLLDRLQSDIQYAGVSRHTIEKWLKENPNE